MEVVGTYEVAEIANVTTAAVANWKKRHEDFPSPIKELKSGPIYRKNEIVEWLKKNGKISFQEEITTLKKKKNIKKIAVVGRSRIGKSRFCGKCLKKEKLIAQKFVGDGKDKTPINFKYILKKDCTNEYIRFVSNKSEINGLEAALTEEGIEKFINTIEEIKMKSKDLFWQLESDCIEIIGEPSNFGKQLMGGEDEVIMMDTPGVSGGMRGLYNLSDVQLYIFLMQPENAEEYSKSLSKMVPVIASGKILFIYRMGSSFTSEDGYKKMKVRAENGMKEFEEDLQVLKKSIIDTGLEILSPAKRTIAMGAFEDIEDEKNFAEVKFEEDFVKMIKNIFEKNVCSEEEKLIEENYSKIKNINEFIEKIKKETNCINIIKGESYREKFLEQRHDRVKFNDGNRVLSLVNINRMELLEKVYKKFSNIEVNQELIKYISKEVQEAVIKMMYKKITESIKLDCGMSVGTHNFEMNPPVTMWALEAIIAEKILEKNALENSKKYCEVMRKENIHSKSWGFVEVNNKPYSGEKEYCNMKLEVIVENELNELESKNAKELIYNSYNLALLKLGEKSIEIYFENLKKS